MTKPTRLDYCQYLLMKKFLFVLILTLISMTNVPTQSETIVTDGLISYWTFDLHNVKDGIAEDVWGENDATIMGNPKIADGHLRQALAFNGLGDYVILSNLGNFGTRIGPSSFEFWLKTAHNDKPSTIFKVIESPCAKNDTGWGIHINAAIKLPNADIVAREGGMVVQYANLRRNGCSSDSNGFRSPISDEKWHHIVYVSGARYIDEFGQKWSANIIYIDNIRQALGRSRETNPDDFVPYTQSVYLGATNNDGKPSKYYFRGSIDEVRVYNRALTHNEVTQNFASGIGLAVESTQKLPIVWGELKTKR